MIGESVMYVETSKMSITSIFPFNMLIGKVLISPQFSSPRARIKKQLDYVKLLNIFHIEISFNLHRCKI